MNYYELRFQEFLECYSVEDALNKIVEILLYQNSQPKLIPYKNKFHLFWNANFINKLNKDNFKTEKYRLAFSQYIRFGIDNLTLCEKLFELDDESFIIAIRFSGIVSQAEHQSWRQLEKLNENNVSTSFQDFLAIVKKLQSAYKERQDVFEKLKNHLKLGQITAMIFSSLYAYEYLIPSQDEYDYLPYQVDKGDKINADSLWKVFDYIIKTSNKNKTILNEELLGSLLKRKLIPFLLGDGLNQELLTQYENFKLLVTYNLEIDNYINHVFNSYSYYLETNYQIKNKELFLEVNENTVKDLWNEKWSMLNNYWFFRGSKELITSEYLQRIIPTGENLSGNFVALAKAFSITLQLKETLGIEQAIFNKVENKIFDIAMTMTLSQAHYLKDHVGKFENNSNDLPAFQNLAGLMMDGFKQGENRMPLTFARQKDKIRRMSTWIFEGSNNQKQKKMEEILDFWTCKLNVDDQASHAQKPFYQIDSIIFQLPWMTAFQNLNSSMINYFRKLHKNRQELKLETSNMETKLAELFRKRGFTVFPQYHPADSHVGEIDLIAVKDEIVIVIELKSSYIRESKKEIFEYGEIVLKKAAYQLKRKEKFICEVFIPEILNKNIESLGVHSWIVDTSLEFDHQRVDGYLKFSIDELIILLNDHGSYLDPSMWNQNLDAMMALSNQQKNDLKNNNVDLVEIDASKFVKAIESNYMWSSNKVC